MSRRKQSKSEQPQRPETAPESGRPAESPEGARRATGGGSAGQAAAPPGPVKRWTRTRNMEVVMRMIRGESVEALSRELGVEVYRLEEWREMAPSRRSRWARITVAASAKTATSSAGP